MDKMMWYIYLQWIGQFSSVQFTRAVLSDTLQPHGLYLSFLNAEL